MKKIIITSLILLLPSYGVFGITRPPKLHNFGNACYFNAIIQALNVNQNLVDLLSVLEVTKPLAQRFKTLLAAIQNNDTPAINSNLFNFYLALVGIQPSDIIPEKQSLPIKEQKIPFINDPELKQALQESQKLYAKAQQERMQLINELAQAFNKTPKQINNLLDQVNDVARQEDAHEFLTRLLDDLRGNPDTESFQKITDLCFFQLRRNKTKGDSLKSTDLENSDSILIVRPIRELKDQKTETIKTLDEALADYFLPDFIQDTKGNQFTITKKIEKFPDMLIIALARATLDLKTLNQKKITTSIEIPFELNLAQYASESSNDSFEYDLFATVNHFGESINSGHYTAFVNMNNNWFECNDNIITQQQGRAFATMHMTINANGYIFFYKKRVSTPPQERLEQQAHHDQKKAIKSQEEQEKHLKKLEQEHADEELARKISEQEEATHHARLQKEEEASQCALEHLRKKEAELKMKEVQREQLKQEKLLQEALRRKGAQEEQKRLKLQKDRSEEERKQQKKQEKLRKKELQAREEQEQAWIKREQDRENLRRIHEQKRIQEELLIARLQQLKSDLQRLLRLLKQSK